MAPFVRIFFLLLEEKLPLVVAKDLLGPDLERFREERRVPREVKADLPGEGKDSLADGDLRQDAVDEMGRDLHHPPSHARGTEAPAPSGEADHRVVAAVRASDPTKTLRKHPAIQVALELLPHVGREPVPAAPVGRALQEGRQVLPHDLVERRLLGLSPAVCRDIHARRGANAVPRPKPRNPRAFAVRRSCRVTFRNMG